MCWLPQNDGEFVVLTSNSVFTSLCRGWTSSWCWSPAVTVRSMGLWQRQRQRETDTWIFYIPSGIRKHKQLPQRTHLRHAHTHTWLGYGVIRRGDSHRTYLTYFKYIFFCFWTVRDELRDSRKRQNAKTSQEGERPLRWMAVFQKYDKNHGPELVCNKENSPHDNVGADGCHKKGHEQNKNWSR